MRGSLVAGVVSLGVLVGSIGSIACKTPPAPPARPDLPAAVTPDAAPAPPRPDAIAPAELGDDVTPIAVRLGLELDPAAGGHRGTIEIDVEVARPVDAIWFHASPELVLASARVTRGKDAVAVERIVAATGVGIAGVALGATLPAGPATLIVEFAGTYRTRDGIFRQVEDGVPFVYSDFEPIDARRAFPGFDLPHWRVPWTVTVRAPEGQDAYANMPRAVETREGDWIAHQFEPTPPLPSYLVAVAVGKFTVVDVPGAAIPSRILVPRTGADVRLAAALIPPVLEAARTVIARPLPWPKLDLVLVPEWSGAMENPGLVTIASTFAIAPRSADLRRLLAMIIAHEIAHLWFGDLVTLRGWNELWLNEGLASWMADQTLAAMTPSQRDPIDRANERLEVYVDDALATTHPLRPDRLLHARALFDRLSYDKGAAVMHTLDLWLGRDRVRAALGGWLDRHAWSHAGSDELIAALAAIDPTLPIAAVVRAAITTTGVPTIAADVVCDPGAARLALEGPPGRPLAVCARWGGAEAGHACTAVDGTGTIALGAACPAWVLPDDGGLAYQHWQLPPRWWTALAAAPPSGAALRVAIEEVMDGVAAGHARPADAIALLAAAVASGEHRLLEPAQRWLAVLAALVPAADRAALTRAVRAATDRALARLGRAPRAGDDPDQTRARATALELAGTLGDDRRVVRWADTVVAAWLRGKAAPEGALAAAIVVTGTRGSAARKRALLAAARKDAERSRAVDRALGRAAAAAGDAMAATFLTPSATTGFHVRALEGVLAALLEDPRRAPAAIAALPPALGVGALIATQAPCATPPPSVGGPPGALLHPRLVLAAARCRAVAARFP